MKYNTTTLNNWMVKAWMMPVPGAAKYRVCQKLTPQQAKEIKQLMAQSLEFDLDSSSARNEPFTNGYPYYDFIGAYLLLMMESGRADINQWRHSLWNALSFQDAFQMTLYAKHKFGVDLNMLMS